MVNWNLSEDLNASKTETPQNFFEPPLAAEVAASTPATFPPDVPPPGTYKFEETYTDDIPTVQTTEVTLAIRATPQQGGFPTHPSLNVPPGAIRVHAMCRGKLTFDAQDESLKLEMTIFASASIKAVPWWGRWVEAKRNPKCLIYENVDKNILEGILQSIPADQNGLFGIEFPLEDGGPVADRDDYIQKFFDGQRYFTVSAGAVIGEAKPRTGGATGECELVLRALYDDDTVMSPRELFYLAFGEKSKYAASHQLFLDLGVANPFVRQLNPPAPVSKWTMEMRPPLRTQRRLIWEVEQEQFIDDQLKLNNDFPHWGSDKPPGTNCKLDPDTPFDLVFGKYRPLDGSCKCNIFCGDLSIRAGFRTAATDKAPNFGFPKAAWQANYAAIALSRQPDETNDAVPLKGPDKREWGWVRTRLLTRVKASDSAAKTKAIAKVNALVDPEGRVLVLAAARPRQPNSKNTKTCDMDVSFVQRPGHIVFVQKVLDFELLQNAPPTDPKQPDFTDDVPTIPPPNPGETRRKETVILRSLKSVEAEAHSETTGGAKAGGIETRQLGGKSRSPGSPTGFIRMHLIELKPGGDPDLLHGLTDLHVKAPPKPSDFLGTKIERAPQNNPINPPVGGNTCCQDKWPDQALATTTGCS